MRGGVSVGGGRLGIKCFLCKSRSLVVRSVVLLEDSSNCQDVNFLIDTDS